MSSKNIEMKSLSSPSLQSPTTSESKIKLFKKLIEITCFFFIKTHDTKLI